mmetsp:Transcript_57231/g.179723  ORF Transcript_57231/g.179723 Transcript_57231/m.179723 type:complete len:231 (+) Transcript_57231:1122-1814(+)
MLVWPPAGVFEPEEVKAEREEPNAKLNNKGNEEDNLDHLALRWHVLQLVPREVVRLNTDEDGVQKDEQRGAALEPDVSSQPPRAGRLRFLLHAHCGAHALDVANHLGLVVAAQDGLPQRLVPAISLLEFRLALESEAQRADASVHGARRGLPDGILVEASGLCRVQISGVLRNRNAGLAADGALLVPAGDPNGPQWAEALCACEGHPAGSTAFLDYLLNVAPHILAHAAG